jgi:hypothetical protein
MVNTRKIIFSVVIELTVTLTSTSITTSSTNAPVTVPTCFNGGNFVDSICHCPSGFGGTLCEQKFGKEFLIFVSVLYFCFRCSIM